MYSRIYQLSSKICVRGLSLAWRLRTWGGDCASRAENAKLRDQRSHFMFIVAGELLKRAKDDEGIKSIITRAVPGIEKPKEKEKAQVMLALYQEEWTAEVKRKATSVNDTASRRAP